MDSKPLCGDVDWRNYTLFIKRDSSPRTMQSHYLKVQKEWTQIHKEGERAGKKRTNPAQESFRETGASKGKQQLSQTLQTPPSLFWKQFQCRRGISFLLLKLHSLGCRSKSVRSKFCTRGRFPLSTTLALWTEKSLSKMNGKSAPTLTPPSHHFY